MAWRKWLLSAWEHALLLLFPPKCSACGRLLPIDAKPRAALCESCLSEWSNEARETCGICLKTVDRCACVTVAMQKAHCAGLRKLTYYRGKQRDVVQNRLIFRIKDAPDRLAVRFCVERLLQPLREEMEARGLSADQCVITYLPRSAAAKAKTGTDQAYELSRELSRATSIAQERLIVRRRGRNRQQKQLRYAERMQNARETYTIAGDADLGGKTVFLVDDIVTSGAGMAQGVRLLRREGAREVICLAIAVDEINRERDVSASDYE